MVNEVTKGLVILIITIDSHLSWLSFITGWVFTMLDRSIKNETLFIIMTVEPFQPVEIEFKYNPNASNFEAAVSDITEGLLSNGFKFSEPYNRQSLCGSIHKGGFDNIVNSLRNAGMNKSATHNEGIFQYQLGYSCDKTRVEKRGGTKSNKYVLRLEPENTRYIIYELMPEMARFRNSLTWVDRFLQCLHEYVLLDTKNYLDLCRTINDKYGTNIDLSDDRLLERAFVFYLNFPPVPKDTRFHDCHLIGNIVRVKKDVNTFGQYIDVNTNDSKILFTLCVGLTTVDNRNEWILRVGDIFDMYVDKRNKLLTVVNLASDVNLAADVNPATAGKFD